MTLQFAMTGLLTAVGLVIGAAIGHYLDGSSQPACWIGAVVGFFLSFGWCILDDVL